MQGLARDVWITPPILVLWISIATTLVAKVPIIIKVSFIKTVPTVRRSIRKVCS